MCFPRLYEDRMFDINSEFGQRVERRLRTEEVIWLTL